MCSSVLQCGTPIDGLESFAEGRYGHNNTTTTDITIFFIQLYYINLSIVCTTSEQNFIWKAL